MSKLTVAPPPPKKKPGPAKGSSGATGTAANKAVHPDQINIATVLVTKNHLALAYGLNIPKITKMIDGVQPFKIEGKSVLYRLMDVCQPIDNRSDIAKRISATNAAKHTGTGDRDFTGEEPPPGSTAAELKTFYQAKQAEQTFIRIKNENDQAAGELLRADDAERTFIEAFKIVAHYLDNLGDILERDGVITHAEVTDVDNSVDKIRVQLAEALSDATNGEVDEL